MKKKILYIDMDGVIVDLHSEVIKRLPDFMQLSESMRHEMFCKLIETDERLFKKPKPIKGAIAAVKLLSKFFDVYFLSSPMDEYPFSYTDKVFWLQKYFGELSVGRIILTKRKDLNIGDYLIDDTLNNGAGEFRGVLINFGTPEFPDWDSLIIYLKAREYGMCDKRM